MRATKIAAVLAVALVLAACGSDAKDTAEDGEPPPSPDVTQGAEPTPSPSPEATTTPTITARPTSRGAPATSAPPLVCPTRKPLGDPATGRTTPVPSSALSSSLSISGDARFVAFRSPSDEVLDNGEDTNGFQDIFVHDRVGGTTKRVNLTDDGKQTDGHSSGVDISADGNWVLFVSKAPNLNGGKREGRVYLRDLRSGKNTQLPPIDPGEDNPEIIGRSISADGRWATYQWQGKSYLYDRTTGKNTRIPGYEGALISADGSTIAVKDAAGGLLSVRARAGGNSETVSVFADGDAPSRGTATDVSMSSDGNRVAFVFDGPDLTRSGCKGPAIYVRDRAKGTTTRVADAPANPTFARISADGRWVISNGSTPTRNGTRFEVLRHDLRTGATTLVSVADDESLAAGPELASSDGAVSRDGRVVAFISNATNLAPGATGQDNVYVREFN